MSRYLSSPDGGNTVTRKIPIANGGSDQITAPLALATFDGVPADQYNQASGVAGLNGLGVLPFTVLPDALGSSVALIGPELLFTGSKGEWTITNYDSQISYTVTCTGGFITRAGDKLYYTAPSTPGTYQISINDKTINIVVDDRYIGKPSIISPVQDALMPNTGVIVTSDDFTIQGGLVNSSVSASDKAANDGFGNFVVVSGDGTRLVISSTGITVDGFLNAGAAYVFRLEGSVWVEEQKLTAFDRATDDRFGRSVAISADGSRIAIGSYWDDVGALVDCGSVYVYSRSGTTWTLEQKITAGDKAANDQLGGYVSLTADGTRLSVAATGCTISGVSNAGAVYIYSRSGTTWTQEAKLIASVRVTQDLFGYACELSSDGTRIAIAASVADIGGIVNCGAIYVFSRSGITWTQEAQLLASDRTTGDTLGYGLGISSTGDRIVAGSYSADVNGVVDCGAAYVFSRSGTTWTQEAKLVPSELQSGMMFGRRVILNTSGNRVFIPAHLISVDGYTEAGAVFVFSRIGTTWSEEQKITESTKGVGNYFGSDAALINAGDMIIIGSSGTDLENKVNCGAAYIYTMAYHASTDWQLSDDPAFSNIIEQSLADTVNLKSWSLSNLNLDTDYYVRCRYNGTRYGTSEWSQTQHIKTRSYIMPTNEIIKLTASDKATSDNLGIFCAVSDDGTRLVAGAQLATVGGVAGAGAAYIFRKDPTGWVEEAKLSASDKGVDDNFGRCVHMSSDGSRVVIGAYYANTSGLTDAGAAYVFSRTGTTWTQEAKLTASDKAISNAFGVAVTISGDGTRIAVGASGCNISGVASAGAVYVFVRSGTTWTQEAKLIASVRVASDYFGYSCYLDYTGTRLVVGADAADISSVVDTGAGYIFVRSGTTWTQEAQLLASDRATGDYFGVACHISANGDRVVFGSYLATVSGLADAGAVYVYSRSGTTWTQEAKLTASDAAATDWFGNMVSMSNDGSIILISAPGKDVNGAANAGAVYIFKRTGTTWTQEAKLVASDADASSSFGSRSYISGDGSIAAIGDNNDNPSGLVSAGSVYIFQ